MTPEFLIALYEQGRFAEFVQLSEGVGDADVLCMRAFAKAAGWGCIKDVTGAEVIVNNIFGEIKNRAQNGIAVSQANLAKIFRDGLGVQRDYAVAVRWCRKAAEQGNARAQTNLGSVYSNGYGVAKDDLLAVDWYRKAAEQGYAIAQFCLAVRHANGRGVEKDDAIAAEWCRKAAEQGYAKAQYDLAERYENGCGVEKDDALAVKWYRRAAEQGDAKAQFNLAVRYEDGRGVNKDDSLAVEWYRKAAEQGNANAQCNLGVMHEDGRGVVKDESLAVEWYHKAAERKQVEALFNIGRMYCNGIGVEQDDKEAVKWFRSAAELRDAQAQRNLGLMYFKGRGVAKNYEEAVKWCHNAAEHGDEIAQCFLGLMYADGKGVAKNDVEAVKWYRKAVEQGDQDAQFNLALMYENGRGVDKDEVLAAEWYRKSAEQGYAKAQFNLAWRYANGLGVEKNDELAVEWYCKSAEHGYVDAQYKLGWMYENGRGVEKDYALAAEWYRKAAEQGHADAQNNLGCMYASGCGVDKSDAKSVELYSMAAEKGNQFAHFNLEVVAERGDASAQFCLGHMYETGLGVEKDDVKAVEWYRKAAEQGHAKAQDKLLMYLRMYHQMASTHISDCYFLPLRELSCHEPNYGQDFINVREILTVEKRGDTLEVQRYPIDVPWNIIRELYLCVFQDYSDENSEGHSNVRYLYGVYDHAWINRWQGGHRSRRWNTTSSILDMQQIFAAFETIAQNHNYLAPFRYKNAYVEEIDRPQPISCEEYLGQLCEIEKRTREKYDANFEEQWENMSHSVVAQARNAEQMDAMMEKGAYLQEKRFEHKEQINNSVKTEIAKYIHEIKVHYYNNARRYIFAQKYAETLSTSRILERLGSDVMMYSTDTIGWTNFDYIISDDVRIKVQTNFGYGVASYFRIIFSYKGIPILPYSMYVNYYYARSRDLARYTRNYDLGLDRKCWERSFDFVVETSNMAASNPDAFVKEWVMREVNDMIEGLRAIVNNPNSVMDKWLDKMDGLENESPYLHVRQMDGEAKKHYECYPREMAMELKAKKISGALDFLESLASLKAIYEKLGG